MTDGMHRYEQIWSGVGSYGGIGHYCLKADLLKQAVAYQAGESDPKSQGLGKNPDSPL